MSSVEEIKCLWNTAVFRLGNLIQDFDSRVSCDVFEDITQIYKDVLSAEQQVKEYHEKYYLICQTNDSEVCASLQDTRNKMRNEVATVVQKYKSVLESNPPVLTPAETDEQFFSKLEEIKVTAGATAKETASEVLRYLKKQPRSELEKLPCPTWDGRRTTYATFKKHFVQAMEENYQDPSKQLLRLRSAIKDHGLKWKRKVDTCSNIDSAWKILDREFQNTPKLIAEMYQGLDRFHLKGSNPDSLADLANIIRELIIQFADIGRPEETTCEVFLAKLREKLSRETLENFKCHMNLKNKAENAENLAEWLDFMASVKDSHSSMRHPERSNNNAVSRKDEKICVVPGCDQIHNISKCQKFKEKPVAERWKLVRVQKLCRKCFNHHHTDRCSLPNSCQKCHLPHHVLLHNDRLNPSAPNFTPNGNNVNANSNQPSKQEIGIINSISVQCPVQKLKVKTPKGKRVNALVFGDCGSDICLMRKSFAKKHGFSGHQTTLNMRLAGGEARTELSEKFDICVSPEDDEDIEKTFTVYTVNKPCSDTKALSMKSLKKYKHLQSIIDKIHIRGGQIDILIGTAFSDAFVDYATKVGKSCEPIAKRNIFGWYILGAIDDKTELANCNFIEKITTDNFTEENTMEDMKKLLFQDQIGIKPTKYCVCSDDELEESRFIKLLNQSTKMVDDRIQVKMPWKLEGPPQKSNYDIAYKRMISTEKSLLKKGKLDIVDREVCKLIDSGFVRKIKSEDINHSQPEFYLPMQAVFTPGKSTEVRLVFDSSAKDKSELSLNDRLEKGPNLINNLLDVLFAWRWNNIAYSGDIQKMFNQVLVHPDDQKYHRFLWRSNQDSEPSVYQWLRLNFGDKPSPPIASNAINILAKNSENDFPEAAKELLQHAYVDDIAGSKPTADIAHQVTRDIDSILQNGTFKIKCWNSNAKLVNNSEETTVHLLGHSWDKSLDKFSFKKDMISASCEPFNKRKCLASIAQLWDPIGLVAPIAIKFRIDMQQLWHSGYSWDEILPREIQDTWRQNIQIMNDLLSITFDRQIRPKTAIGLPEVHGFCDGGERAFGGVIFLRWTLENGFHCVPILAKALVAPLKKKSIPRLELLGCLTLVRMYKTIIKSLSFADSKQFQTYFWCDSSTVLKWIKTPPQKYKAFVSARIAEIQESIDVKDFRYIPSELNPADALTRGIDVAKLSKWLEGPEFLGHCKSDWPKGEMDSQETNQEELQPLPKTIKSVDANVNVQKLDYSLLDKLMDNCNDYSKIRRHIAFMVRFINYITKKPCEKGPLTVKELLNSQNVLFRLTQRHLNVEKLSPGYKLARDENNVYRAHGRLENIRALPIDLRNPIVFPKDHRLVSLLTQHVHIKSAHCGYKRLMAEMQKRFWIPGLRNIAKQITSDCITCRKLRKRPLEQIMGQIPELRVATGLPVFYNTALDMFGPVHIKLGRQTRKEGQIIIFTCMTTRAIHLELVTDKSSDTFIMAYRRFICLRGQAKNVFSDQGTNFVGAQTYFQYIMKDWDTQKLKNVLSEEFHINLQLQWHWNIPHASHMNGVVESLIKSVRNALNATYKLAEYTEEQWHTILAETVYLINSRPLYPPSNNIFEEPPITPNDLLQGPHIIPPQPKNEEKVNPRHWNKSVQKRVSEFWKSWLKYFSPNLLPRNKWFKVRENIEVGDLVIEVDSNIKRKNWKMAVIDKVYPGLDGRVRKVQLRTASGIYDRPIHKLCLIATKGELNS